METDTALTRDVHLKMTPGHTPGHLSVWVGHRCVITGDVLHHAIQFRHPPWMARGDADSDAARAIRRALLAPQAAFCRPTRATASRPNPEHQATDRRANPTSTHCVSDGCSPYATTAAGARSAWSRPRPHDLDLARCRPLTSASPTDGTKAPNHRANHRRANHRRANHRRANRRRANRPPPRRGPRRPSRAGPERERPRRSVRHR